MRATPLLNNFTSGEWSPLLAGRSDLEQYSHSAETIENILVTPYGGVTKIPGTHFVAEVKNSAKKVRLIPFEFNVTQAYTLEFGDQYIRFYMDHGQIVHTLESVPAWDPGQENFPWDFVKHGDIIYRCILYAVGPGVEPPNETYWVATDIYEIGAPYLEADLSYLQKEQEADIMYITHSSYPPKKLSRTDHNAWTLTDYIPREGPLLPTNLDVDSTITPTADSGMAITLNAVNEIFDEGHRGNFVWRIKNGYVKIIAFVNTKQVTADVMYGGNLGTGPAATDDWAEAAWSAYRGYPGCITLYEQRLCFAYSPYKPQTIWCTASGNYELMLIGAEAADALVYTLATGQVIRWIFGDEILFVGTSGGVFHVSSGDTAYALSPTNIVVRRRTPFGCNTIPPVKMGNLLYYIQRNNLTLREYVYEYSSESFLATDVTLLAEHILKPEVLSIGYQQSPYNLLYCIRSDGEVAVFTRNLIQKVMGWARLPDSGKAESVAVISRATGGDEVWFVYNRTIGEGTKRYIEYLEEFEFGSQEDAFFVRSGLSHDGEPISTIEGLRHLEGEEVVILGDGAVFPRETVDAEGRVTIATACEKIHVGLPYKVKGKLQKLEFGSSLGTAQAKIQRIAQLAIKFYRSLGCSYGVEGKMDILSFRSTSMAMDAPPDLFTGERIIVFPKGYARDIKILIEQDQPLPLTILSMVAFGETYES